MKFQVFFEATHNGRFAIEKPGRGIGVEDLVYLRDKFGQQVSLNQVESIKCRYENVAVTVPEELVYELHRERGLFAKTSNYTVHVPPKELNRFVNLEAYHETKPGKVASSIFGLRWVLNEKALLGAWIYKGCPRYRTVSFTDVEINQALEVMSGK
jgi:hypothetical protein